MDLRRVYVPVTSVNGGFMFGQDQCRSVHARRHRDRHQEAESPDRAGEGAKNKPILAFNDLKEQTDLDEQGGMMHLFMGAVLALRNPRTHARSDLLSMTDGLWLAVALIALVVLGGLWLAREVWIHRRRRRGD